MRLNSYARNLITCNKLWFCAWVDVQTDSVELKNVDRIINLTKTKHTERRLVYCVPRHMKTAIIASQ